MRKGKQRKILNTIDELPAVQRRAVILVKWNHLTYHEAGKAMNLPADKVQLFVERAKEYFVWRMKQ